MSRSDDTLRRRAHERLHAVAHREPATTSVPSRAADDDLRDASIPASIAATGPAPATPSDDVPPPAGAPGDGVTARGRHRSASPPPALPLAGTTRPGADVAVTARPGPAPVGAPVPVPGPDPSPVEPASEDVRDVVERMRREALAEAAAQYGEQHGHPLDHPGTDPGPATRRWYLTMRHAVVAGAAVVLLTAGVVVRATAEVPQVLEPPGEAVTEVAGAVAGGATPGPAAPAPPGDAAGAVSGPGSTGTGGPGGGAPGGAAPTTGTGTSAPGQGEIVVVHVVGQVHAPGVVQLSAGSRVEDAIRAAGGAAAGADLAAVNLARVLADGEQLVVPAPGETVPVAPGAGTGTGAAGARPTVVDLNAADLADLDALPGIGPVLAERILAWRADNGPFRDVEELGEVSGIGDALLGRLRPLVAV